MSAYSIGVDLGGTNLRAAAVDSEGTILNHVARPTPMRSGVEIVDEIAAGVLELRDTMGASDLVGIGVAVPGFIDMHRGVVVGWSKLPNMENFPMKAELERRIGSPVVLENDANAAALGEKWIGAGRDVDDMIAITLGTGVGGGVIIGGNVLHGFVGMAGEIGHITVEPDGRSCGCGNNGCLETVASATAIARAARAAGLGAAVTSKEVYDAAQQGDVRALAVFRRVGWGLGVGIATLANIFNFPLFVICGGPIPAWDFFAPTMIAEARRRSFTVRNTATRIEPAKLRNEAGLHGSALLPFRTGSRLDLSSNDV